MSFSSFPSPSARDPADHPWYCPEDSAASQALKLGIIFCGFPQCIACPSPAFMDSFGPWLPDLMVWIEHFFVFCNPSPARPAAQFLTSSRFCIQENKQNTEQGKRCFINADTDITNISSNCSSKGGINSWACTRAETFLKNSTCRFYWRWMLLRIGELLFAWVICPICCILLINLGRKKSYVELVSYKNMGIRSVREGKHNRWKPLELAGLLLISFLEYFHFTSLENTSAPDLDLPTVFIVFGWGKGEYIKTQIKGRNKIYPHTRLVSSELALLSDDTFQIC